MGQDTRPKVIVIGGGLAGIAACERLSRDPRTSPEIILLEGRPHLGGRIGSFTNRSTGRETDLGQHLFMSCYDQTLALLSSLGTRESVVFYDRLVLPLWDRNRGLNTLDIPESPNPVALANGLLQYDGLPFISRLAFLALTRSIPEVDSDVDHLSAHDFLLRAGQPKKVIDRFWELVVLSATNLPTKSVSASILVRILKESLLRGGGYSRPGYNAITLSELFVRPAMNLFAARGVAVRLKSRATALSDAGGRLTSIMTSEGSVSLGPHDHCIAAVPPWAFEKLAPISWDGSVLLDQMSRLSYPSPILSIHLHLTAPVSIPVITGFHESKIHWLFNKDAMELRLIPEKRTSWFDWTEEKAEHFPTRNISATVSGANDLMEADEAELARLILGQIRKIDRIHKTSIHSITVVRDRFATPVLGVGQSSRRPDARTPLENFWIAGDATDTGLPATMEGAVRSGFHAASLILAALGESRTIPNRETGVPA